MKTLTHHLRSGFSLIEVTLAIGVLSVGTLALMALFPMGLKESSDAQSDMRQAIFADFVLSCASAAAAAPGITTTRQFLSEFKSISSLQIDEETKNGSGPTSVHKYTPSDSPSDRGRLFYRVWLREPNDDTSGSVLRKDIRGTYLVCVQSTDRSQAGSAQKTFLMSPVYVTSIYLSDEDDLE